MLQCLPATGLDENTLAQPTKIVPVTTTLDSVGSDFNYTFKANSVTILKLNTGSTNSVGTIKKKDDVLTVYPNPGKNFICVKGSGPEDISVELRNMIGQTVLSKKIQSGNKINISSLQSGVYIVAASQGINSCSTSMIKE
jgi:hypothetical protein